MDVTDSDSTSADPTDSSRETASASDATEHVETTVPEDATAHRCPYCDRPFAIEERVTLHVGLTHYDVCTDAEVDAFQSTYTAENEAIRRYRLKAAAVLIVVYFGFLMVYAVFGVAG
jgi:hypothetical protein